jgi:CO/xanthine dehydrogenase Mo-binding subunit
MPFDALVQFEGEPSSLFVPRPSSRPDRGRSCRGSFAPCAGRKARGQIKALRDRRASPPRISNFPNGCDMCEVEFDPETGSIRVVRYVAVDHVSTGSWQGRGHPG